MYQQILNFIGIGILSAFLAVIAIIGNAMRIDKDPAVDGPRALVAEFFGLWVALAFLAWSFMIPGPPKFQWVLRGIAAAAAILGFTLAAYFAGTPEVRVNLDEEPTGFDSPITGLDLHDRHTEKSDLSPDSLSPKNHTWSELNAQPTGHLRK
jgi:hypothetical protein